MAFWTVLQRGLLSGLLSSALACSPSALPAGHSLEAPPAETVPPSARSQNAEPSISQALSHTQSSEAASASENETYAPMLALEPKAVPPLLLPPEGRRIGSKGPMALEAMSAEAHWIAYCHSKRQEDKEVQLTLQLGNEALAISSLLRADPKGRYVAVLIDGTAWLMDGVSGARWDLSELEPDLRFDGLSEHRSFAFTHNALLVLSTSVEANTNTVFAIDLRNLEKDQPFSQVRISLKGEVIYRIEAESNYAWTVSLPENSTTKYWPARLLSQPAHRCLQNGIRFSAFERLSSFRPDPYIRHSWVYLPQVDVTKAELHFESAPGFVFGFGEGWVRRLDTGRLMLVRGRTQRQIASQRCGARVLHAEESSGQFLIACEEFEPLARPTKAQPTNAKRPPVPKSRFDLYLIKPGWVRSLGADIARTGTDVRGVQGQRFVPLHPGAASALVDLHNAELISLEGDAKIMAIGPGGVLVRRGSELRVWSAAGHKEELLAHTAADLAPVLVQTNLVSIGTQVFDLRAQLRTWSLPAEPLALSASGHSLLASGILPMGAQGFGTWTQGPWILLPPEPPVQAEQLK